MSMNVYTCIVHCDLDAVVSIYDQFCGLHVHVHVHLHESIHGSIYNTP